MSEEKPKSVRKNFRLPSHLAEWIEGYCKKKNTNMSRLIVEYFTYLQEQEEAKK